MKQQNLFVIFCLILTLGLIQAYGVFKDFYSDSRDLQKQVVYWKEAKQREELKVVLAENRMKDFEIEVAQVLPSQSFQQKNILNQVRVPASDADIDLSSVELEKGRRAFRERDYSQAIRIFQGLIEKFPNSGKTIEARFLLAESYFLSGKQTECVAQIDQMMTLYPENEMTGFIMLRLGQLLEARNQSDEASEVYRTVRRRFPASQSLQHQTNVLLKTPGHP